MKNIRDGNDIHFVWAIVRNGQPEDLSKIVRSQLTLKSFSREQQLSYEVVDVDKIRIELKREVTNEPGAYNLEFAYTITDTGFSDGLRNCCVDVDPCEIVTKSKYASASNEYAMTSEMAIAFKGDKGDKGDSSYQVWIDAGNIGTEEDYFAYLRQPAVDAIESIQAVEQTVSENESLRIVSETSRKDAEDLRLSAETLRKENETERVSKESVRIENETERVSKESIRNENEVTRGSNENTRNENEEARVLTEASRVDAEGDRVTNEDARVDAEGDRVTNEDARIDAEDDRVANENIRISNEQDRQTNTATAISNAEQATQETITAASLADAARLAIEGELALKQNNVSQYLQTTSKSVVGAINEVNKIVSIHHADNRAVRRWDNTLSTPIGEAVGDIAFLRELPRILGLGCYLVEDDLTMRKLHRENHNFYEDGSPALLDGTEGQYMFCWEAFYYTTWEEGNYTYEAISLQPIIGKKSYYIPAGGYSAIGHGVIDRDTLTLCSVVSSLPRYRGGNNAVIANKLAGASDPQTTMLGMPATVYGIQTALAYARKRGDSWSACWFVSRSAVEILISIIYGNRHTQSAVLPKDANGLYQGGFGAGLTAIGDADWSNYNGYYPLVPTNAGVELGDVCGSFDYTIPKADGTAYHVTGIPSFFGLKNFFGHLWFGVAGLTINAGENISEAYIKPTMYDGWNHNSLEGMLKAAELPRVNGYIGKLSMNLLCALPIELGASASTKYADYFYENTAGGSYGFRARWGGGSAASGTAAGAFYPHSHSAATYASAARSVPLCFFKEDPIIE